MRLALKELGREFRLALGRGFVWRHGFRIIFHGDTV